MPLVYVHVCSRCGERKEDSTPTRPNGWAHADVKVESRGYDIEKTFDWCSACWARIETKYKVPQPGGQI